MRIGDWCSDVCSSDLFVYILWSIVSWSQLLGGPPRAAFTAGLSHWIGLSRGFWCSWIMPIMCPNSCCTTPWSSQPKFIVGWLAGTPSPSVPTYDQAPSSLQAMPHGPLPDDTTPNSKLAESPP